VIKKMKFYKIAHNSENTSRNLFFFQTFSRPRRPLEKTFRVFSRFQLQSLEKHVEMQYIK